MLGAAGRTKFSPFKRGGGAQKVLPCLEGRAKKVSDPRFSHFVALPVMNDQSLGVLLIIIGQLESLLFM